MMFSTFWGGHFQRFGHLLDGWFAAQALGQLVLDAEELVDMIAHVDRDTDGASLVGNRACHGLADPPGGIGAEFITPLVVELLGGTDQADIAFLDQVKEGLHRVPYIFWPH